MRMVMLVLCCSLLLGGCAVLSGKDSASLPIIAERFSEAMRWQDYPSAARFVEPQFRDSFLEQFSEDRDLFVVDSRVEPAQVDPEGGRAEAVYLLEYFRLPSNRVMRWTWTQDWVRQSPGAPGETLWLIGNAPPPLPWRE